MRLAYFLPVLLMLPLAVAQPNPASSEPKTVPATDGWRSLFDGKTLAGWKSAGTARWRVEDGVIVGGQDGDPKRSGLLMTEAQFQNYELELEFMIDEHGKYNSGVYLRKQAEGLKGYQVNLGRGAAEEYCGGLYTDRWLAKGDEKDTIRRPLAWNQLRIVAKGAHFEVVLNGKEVVNFTDPNPPEAFLKPGNITLQTYGAEGHSGWVKFRNVRVRSLP